MFQKGESTRLAWFLGSRGCSGQITFHTSVTPLIGPSGNYTPEHKKLYVDACDILPYWHQRQDIIMVILMLYFVLVQVFRTSVLSEVVMYYKICIKYLGPPLTDLRDIFALHSLRHPSRH